MSRNNNTNPFLPKHDNSARDKREAWQLARKIRESTTPEALVSIEIMCLALSSFRQVNAPGELGRIASEWQWLGWIGAWASLWLTVYRDSIIVGQFSKLTLPVLRRVYPILLANDVVSVQPMTSPAGYIWSMDYVYDEAQRDTMYTLGPVPPEQYGPVRPPRLVPRGPRPLRR